MKLLGLILAMIFSPLIVNADVTAEILSHKIDDNGNIEVHTQYKIDGVEVPSRYPQEDGKYYFVTRYDASVFGGMNENQIKDRILNGRTTDGADSIKSQCDSLLIKSFLNKENKDIADNKMKTLPGSTISSSQADIGVDTDGDGKSDKIWVVKTDGTKIEKNNILISP